jgi:hypothetical protein
VSTAGINNVISLTATTNNTSLYGQVNNPTFNLNSGSTGTSVYSTFSECNAVVASGVSANALFSGYFVGPTATGAGSVSYAVALRATNPTIGASANIAAFFDNMAIGAAVTPPTSGFFSTGAAIIGSSSLFNGSTTLTVNLSGNTNGIALNGSGTGTAASVSLGFYESYTYTTSVANHFSIEIDNTVSIASGETLTTWVSSRVTPNGGVGTGTVSEYRGYSVDAFAAGSASCTLFRAYYYDGSLLHNTTYAYGAYYAAPTGGSGSNCAFYADNGVCGYTQYTPPTNSMVVKGAFVAGSQPSSVTAGTMVTAPPTSHTATANFATTMSLNSYQQNTTGYDLMATITIPVTVATGMTILAAVGPTNSLTPNQIVPSTSVTGNYTFSIIVPSTYYLYINATGTFTAGTVAIFASPI